MRRRISDAQRRSSREGNWRIGSGRELNARPSGLASPARLRFSFDGTAEERRRSNAARVAQEGVLAHLGARALPKNPYCRKSCEGARTLCFAAALDAVSWHWSFAADEEQLLAAQRGAQIGARSKARTVTSASVLAASVRFRTGRILCIAFHQSTPARGSRQPARLTLCFSLRGARWREVR